MGFFVLSINCKNIPWVSSSLSRPVIKAEQPSQKPSPTAAIGTLWSAGPTWTLSTFGSLHCRAPQTEQQQAAAMPRHSDLYKSAAQTILAIPIAPLLLPPAAASSSSHEPTTRHPRAYCFLCARGLRCVRSWPPGRSLSPPPCFCSCRRRRLLGFSLTPFAFPPHACAHGSNHGGAVGSFLIPPFSLSLSLFLSAPRSTDQPAPFLLFFFSSFRCSFGH